MKRWLRFLAKFLAGAVVLVLALTAVLWWVSKPARPDDFYLRSAEFPAAPGKLVKIEPFTRMVPANANGWRLLYSTTRFDGSIAPASAIVLAPKERKAEPANVIAWTHGTTGFDPACAPSVLDEPFANVPALEEALAEGWVIVATDYIGLGTDGPHPYLIGEGQARSALDSIRALKQIENINVSDGVVVWGHSQGGNAALWTGILAASYAPDVKINGVAALAPATDLPGLVKAAEKTSVGKILSSYIISAYSGTYPDVKFEEYIKPMARPVVSDMSSRCLAGTEALFLVAETFITGETIFAKDPSTGPLGERLKENTPNRPIPAPVMIAQGLTDELVLPELQQAFVDGRCKAGQAVEYVRYYERDHLTLVAKDSPLTADLIGWTRDRQKEKAAAATCSFSDK